MTQRKRICKEVPLRHSGLSLTGEAADLLRLKGFIFDIDGTLVDSIEAHIASWQEAFAEHGFDIDVDELRYLVGMGSDKMIPRLTGLAPANPRVAAIAKTKKAIYEARDLPKVCAFEGVKELLRTLRRLGM